MLLSANPVLFLAFGRSPMVAGIALEIGFWPRRDWKLGEYRHLWNYRWAPRRLSRAWLTRNTGLKDHLIP